MVKHCSEDTAYGEVVDASPDTTSTDNKDELCVWYKCPEAHLSTNPHTQLPRKSSVYRQDSLLNAYFSSSTIYEYFYFYVW